MHPSTRACAVRSQTNAPATAMAQSGSSQPRSTRQNHSHPMRSSAFSWPADVTACAPARHAAASSGLSLA
eukprot:7707102-Lingulodinium_polyedra.AAC.1